MSWIKTWFSLAYNVATGLAAICCILIWLKIEPRDIGAAVNGPHWLWLVGGLFLLVVNIGLSVYRIRRRPVLSESVIGKIKEVGKLESLAGRADYLVQILDDLYHQFNKSKKPFPFILGVNAVPDVISEHLDREVFRFRDKYSSYLGSLKTTIPDCDSQLMKEGYVCNGQEYPDLKRKIEAHAAHLRKLANELSASAKEEYAKNQSGENPKGKTRI